MYFHLKSAHLSLIHCTKVIISEEYTYLSISYSTIQLTEAMVGKLTGSCAKKIFRY